MYREADPRNTDDRSIRNQNFFSFSPLDHEKDVKIKQEKKRVSEWKKERCGKSVAGLSVFTHGVLLLTGAGGGNETGNG